MTHPLFTPPPDWDGQEARPAALHKSEYTKLLEWRARQLFRAGAESLTAAALATTKNDLHVMTDAYEAGMTDDQARPIFLN